MRALLLLACLSACAIGLTAPVPAVGAAAEAKRDWTETVVKTAEGGYRMGNPAAPVKLIEYGSLACPTCARFAADSEAPLMAKVRSGKLSFEFRNIVLNAPDMAAAILTRCAAPTEYFSLNQRFFSAQPGWMEKVRHMSEAEAARIAALPPLKQLAPIAAAGGMGTIAAEHGVTPARARQCLGDAKLVDGIVQVQKAAAGAGVRGTPTFFINGRRADGVLTWAALAPLLTPPGG